MQRTTRLNDHKEKIFSIIIAARIAIDKMFLFFLVYQSQQYFSKSCEYQLGNSRGLPRLAVKTLLQQKQLRRCRIQNFMNLTTMK